MRPHECPQVWVFVFVIKKTERSILRWRHRGEGPDGVCVGLISLTDIHDSPEFKTYQIQL
jgi:hypothetical protein